jgi:hypothetical protein
VNPAEPPLRIVQELIETESAVGFRRLRRVPSSKARRFIDYYDDLPPADATALRAALADRGALLLAPHHGRMPAPDLAPAYERWANAMRSARFSVDLRYQPLRIVKNIVGAGLADEWTFDSESAREAAGIKSATAALLRRLIKPVFLDRFGLVGRNQRGGDWSYEREDGMLKVRLDFGGRSDQLRYWVTATDPRSGHKIVMATYEGLLGLTSGWDWITEDDAPHAVDLLAELVSLIQTLPRELAGPSPNSQP